MCLLTNERYKTYQTGFSFCHLGHALGVGLGGTAGGWGSNFFPKFNQIWRVSYLHQWHMQRHNILGPHPLGPCGRAKRSNIIKSQSQKAISKIFKPHFVCLLTNDRYKTYQTGFSFHRLGHAPLVGLMGTVGVWGGQQLFSKFNQIWCVNYLHEWHMQRHNFLGPRLLGPWGGAKRSNIIKYQLQSQFQDF